MQGQWGNVRGGTYIVNVQAMWHEWHNRRNAHDLLDDAVQVRKTILVMHVRKPLRADDRVNFCLRSTLDLRVESHHQEKSPDRGNRLQHARKKGM
jgi:hypothetical protein